MFTESALLKIARKDIPVGIFENAAHEVLTDKAVRSEYEYDLRFFHKWLERIIQNITLQTYERMLGVGTGTIKMPPFFINCL